MVQLKTRSQLSGLMKLAPSDNILFLNIISVVTYLFLQATLVTLARAKLIYVLPTHVSMPVPALKRKLILKQHLHPKGRT